MNKKEIIEKLLLEDFSSVYNEADKIRRENKGEVVFLRAIIEFSSYCYKSCLYCGLNKNNTNAKRYRMDVDEIVSVGKRAIDADYKTLVLQGGEDGTFADGEKLMRVIHEIKSYNPKVAITLSAGELRSDVLKKLKEAGADRYLLRHETSKYDLYSKLHPGEVFENRLKCLYTLKELGYETGSGFMVGLPGQTIESLADDILLIGNIPCDMVGIGPYIPHPETELRGNKAGSLELTKRCVALVRHILPKANLPVTTALGVLSQEERKRAFSCGANVIMRKVNPLKYKEAYQIYPAVMGETDIVKEREEIEELVKSVGRIPQ